MTPKQTQLYWREWGAVSRAAKAAGRDLPDRHSLHRQALGRDVSSKDFSNAQFDAVLGVFRALSQPGNLNGQWRQLDQPRRREEFSLDEVLRCLALYVEDAEAYMAVVMADKFKRPLDVGHLTEKQTFALKITLWARINKKGTGFRNQAGHSVHQMKSLAEVPCDCARCRDLPSRQGRILQERPAVEAMEEQPF